MLQWTSTRSTLIIVTTTQGLHEQMAFKAKLTPMETARLVTDVRQNGMTQTAAAIKYGISRRTVNRILHPERGVSKKPKLKPCGTVAAYRRHLRNKEVPCLKCCAANAKYTKACKQRKKKNESERLRREDQYYREGAWLLGFGAELRRDDRADSQRAV